MIFQEDICILRCCVRMRGFAIAFAVASRPFSHKSIMDDRHFTAIRQWRFLVTGFITASRRSFQGILRITTIDCIGASRARRWLASHRKASSGSIHSPGRRHTLAYFSSRRFINKVSLAFMATGRAYISWFHVFSPSPPLAHRSSSFLIVMNTDIYRHFIYISACADLSSRHWNRFSPASFQRKMGRNIFDIGYCCT